MLKKYILIYNKYYGNIQFKQEIQTNNLLFYWFNSKKKKRIIIIIIISIHK